MNIKLATKSKTDNADWAKFPFSLAREHGPGAAAVWAAIHRYEQLDKHCCTISFAKIGEMIGRNKITVCHIMKVLVDNGYVRLVRDNRNRGKPNWYATTSKINLEKHSKTKKSTVKSGFEDEDVAVYRDLANKE